MNTTLDTLWQECRMLGHLDPAYVVKQLHPLPAAPVVDRIAYLVEQCQGQRVLHLGCASGDLHTTLGKVANGIYGVDIEPGLHTWLECDLDREPERVYTAAQEVGIDVIVAAEILEHLANPGRCLDVLRQFQRPLVVTAPNAFTTVGRQWLERGYENCHRQHVAWYSYHTLRGLLARSGFTVTDFAYYNGVPLYAEGLIMRAMPDATG